MSFAGANDVMTVVEALIKRVWQDRRSGFLENLRFPFKRLSYDTAISTYGSDKPDLRFDHSRVGHSSSVPTNKRLTSTII